MELRGYNLHVGVAVGRLVDFGVVDDEEDLETWSLEFRTSMACQTDIQVRSNSPNSRSWVVGE